MAPKNTTQAVIACGSNLNDPTLQLNSAREKISGLPKVRLAAVSRFYVTRPVGMTDQPDFLNGAFLIETTLSSRELLGQLLAIERSQGRVRGTKNGPRSLDLDLIFFGEEIRNEEGLELPHPRAHEREFVLRPISEIAPDWMHPVLKKTVKILWEELCTSHPHPISLPVYQKKERELRVNSSPLAGEVKRGGS